jgi:MSHA pilin protein MshC
VQGRTDCGFTLVELVTILILVALLAFTAIPRQPALTLGVAAQVDQLAADIRFTQSLAMTHGDRFRINLAATGYQITDSSGAGVAHPVTQSTAAIALDSVTLSGYNPPLTNSYLAFDGRGVPFAAVTSSTPLAADVTITLAGNGETRTIVVTRDTGRVSLP